MMDIFWSDKAIFIIVDDPFPLDIPSPFWRRPSDFLIGNHIFKSIKLFLCVSYCTSDFRSMWKMLLFYLMQCYALIISSIIFAAEIHISSLKRNKKNWYIIHSLYKWRVTWNYFYNRSPLNPTLFPVNVYCRLLQYTPKAMFMVGMGRSQELV